MTGAEFTKAQVVLREYPGQYSWARCIRCNDPGTHFVQEDKDEFYLFCDRHAPDYAEFLNPQAAIIYGDRDTPRHPAKLIEAFMPENLMATVDQLSGPGLAKLGTKLGRTFEIRLQSTGSKANVALNRILMQTYFVSARNPCLVTFDQFILTPFTGPGQFDLVERDATDIDVFDFEGNKISGGESEITIATKSGFTKGVTTEGASHLVKVNTADKVYKVKFVPGTAGDGIYSITARELNLPPTRVQANLGEV